MSPLFVRLRPVLLPAAVALLALILVACASPARETVSPVRETDVPAPAEPPGTARLTITVVGLPPGDVVDMTRPLPSVSGATVAVRDQLVTTDANGQVDITVPFGDLVFVVTPPPDSPLKRATYRERVEAGGNRSLSLPLSPNGEVIIDNTQRRTGWPGLPAPARPDQPILGQLCPGTVKPDDRLTEKAVAEVTAAVTASGGDLDALRERLAQLAGAKSEPAVTTGDVDGDGQPDLVVTFGWCYTPALLYRAAAPDQPVIAPMKDRPTWRYAGSGRVDRIADVNDDGLPELVVAYDQAGASSSHTFLYIYQWSGKALAALFTDHLSNWVGENQWRIADGTVSIQCHPFGGFEHKLMEHRQQTELFRWEPVWKQYRLAERNLEPATTRHLQASWGELYFQRGDYETAAAEFRRVAGLPEEGVGEPDWVALAHLRLGQMEALAGRRTEALAHLDQAAKGRDPVGPAAARFREAYAAAGDAADGFWALWTWVRESAMVPGMQNVVRDSWLYSLEPHTLGARPAMERAFRAADRPMPLDGPDAREFPAPDCLQVTW